MVAYCPTTISGGICTDAACPNRHDISRCEPCNCTLATHLLEQHQSGKRHLSNVAPNGPSDSGGPQQPTSQPGLPNAQSVPPTNTLPPSSGGVPTHAADPRVIVSNEGGLDFIVEGTINAGNPSFSSADIVVSITKTEVLSSLSVQSVVVAPLPNPQFSASLVGNAQEVRRKKPGSIRVSFHASRAGNFHGSLMITFIDKTRRDDREFTVTRELRGRAILPGGPASNGEASETATEVRVGSEGTGISVSPESGLEFSVERPRSDVPFATQTLKLVISKSSPKPLVSFKAAKLRSLDESVAALFSAQLQGNSMKIKPKAQRTVTVSFTPRREGLCEAVLELTFYDRKRNADFVVERTLRGVVMSLPTRDWADDNESLASGEGEELLDSTGTGISVSGEDGLDFGIVGRTHLDGPFATPTSSLTIMNAEGFPAVTLVNARIRTLFGSDSSFIATNGDTHLIQPGTESTVYIQFNPEFEGVFEATLKLVFYDSQRSARFVVPRGLHGIAGTLDDHRHFESLNQVPPRRPTGGRQVPPRREILLSHPSRGRKSRKLPEYELPPIVQEAVDNATFKRPYDMEAPGLIATLSPPGLNMETYARYFKALVNVEDGHQQRDVLDLPPYEVEVEIQQRDQGYRVEIEDKDEDLLPEVIIGDFLWLDDIQEDIRYEARITDVYVFTRRHAAVLKMSLRLPIDFNLYRGATFMLRFRLNRITLRREYHSLATFSPQRRLLFPSVSDIKPIKRRLSRTEIQNLKLANENIRDDEQQLQTVVSILQQPKGTAPFIIYGPPGTGKTSTVVESIMQLVRRGPSVKVLACTPSNAAADLLVERLSVAGLNDTELFRLNAYSRYEDEIPEGVQPFSVLSKRAKLLAYRVVLSTCSSTGLLQTLNVPAGHFSHIVIDEAAQADEPLAMIPIANFSTASTNIILAGDPHQLGPVIKSPTASRTGLGRSYLDRLMRIRQVYGLDTQGGTTIVDLQRNRRSHDAIIAWPNRFLYEDRMRACASADVTHVLLDSRVLPKKGFPVVFHGVKGREKRSRHSPSLFNIHEASIVRDYCQKLTTDPELKIYPEDIGIVAPYKAQVRTIRDLLKRADLGDVDVGSVEQFQGQERKVIIFATTRSNSAVDKRRAMGFLQHRQRMNVAITRAQAMLIVVGDPDVLGKDELWRTFLNYIYLCGGWTGKMLSWRPQDQVSPPGYSIIPREQPMYGEEFIGKKSENIYRHHE